MADSEPIRKELVEFRDHLCGLGQAHLFDGWGPDEENSEKKTAFLQQLWLFDHSYAGGVEGYIKNGKKLVAEAAQGATFKAAPSLPQLVFPIAAHTDGPNEWRMLEEQGEELMKKTAFVLVAGGLGERLGYNGIKLKLPNETATRTSYLAHYANWILQYAGPDAPFVIMTSDDTHEKTIEVLRQNNQFGLSSVHLLKQEAVLCITDAEAHIARKDRFELLRKPHGHGDVHSLIYKSQLCAMWWESGFKYVAFFQDTNAAAVFTLPVTLAVAEKEHMGMLFTTVPRLPGEAVGALSSIKTSDGVERTINVEYNLFGPLLQATTGKGDVPVPGTRYSPYPGSINTLLLRISVYREALYKCKGQVPEFINPKYADATKTTFKSPARLECMMQDIAQVFAGSDRAGGIVFPRYMYTPVKNSWSDAVAKVNAGLDAHGALTGETGYYTQTRMMFKGVGCHIGDDTNVSVGDFSVPMFPIIVPNAVFGLTTSRIQKRIPDPSKVSVSSRSVLLLEGDVIIKQLELDGALSIRCIAGASVTVESLRVSNDGWGVSTTVPPDAPEEIQMRRFTFTKKATMELVFDRPGSYVVNQDRISKM